MEDKQIYEILANNNEEYEEIEENGVKKIIKKKKIVRDNKEENFSESQMINFAGDNV